MSGRDTDPRTMVMNLKNKLPVVVVELIIVGFSAVLFVLV